MGMDSMGGIGGDISGVILEAMSRATKEEKIENLAKQVEAKQMAQKDTEEEVYNPKAAKQAEKKPLKSRPLSRLQKMKGAKQLLPVKAIEEKAQQHQQRNPELKAKVLRLLREKIKPGDNQEDILKTLEEFYSDPTLADEALEFLLDTTEGDLKDQVKKAKETLLENKGREIQAGRNIAVQARQAADKGLGTPTSLRDMYRDVTGNPRDANTMFEELTQKYAYNEITKVIKFLLHSMGADASSAGPSIEPGKLHNLMTETRTLQAILGVYRFFNGRMKLVKKLFEQNGIPLPKGLNFETLAKSFMHLAGERFPSSDKVLNELRRINIENNIMAKIITGSQFRDSIKEVSVNKIYRSVQHRDDLFNSVIEALEDLEDQLDDLRENEEAEEELDEEQEDKQLR